MSFQTTVFQTTMSQTTVSPARFDVVTAMTAGCARRNEPPADTSANLTKPQQSQPSPSVLPRCCNSSPSFVMGATVPKKRRTQPMTLVGPEPSRSESGDPVCRMFRLPYVPPAECSGVRCSGARSLTGRRCQPLGAILFRAVLRAFEAARHHLGPIPWPQASRFRPTFQALFCRGPKRFCRGSMPHGHAPLWATRARGVPLRSLQASNGARPAAANNAATGSA